MTQTSTSEVLQGVGLRKIFGKGPTAVRAVDNVSLGVSLGELVLIMGPSGSGKTTLISMLGGLLGPDDGEVKVLGETISSLSQAEMADMRTKRIGFVFQSYNLLSALTVQENILFPVRLAKGQMSDARSKADELMRRLGIYERRHAKPSRLSGGEKQRVAIARALINDPPIILADEPTGNLDSERGLEVTMILREIARSEQKAVVVVSHDPRIEDVADRVLWLEDGMLRDRKREAHEWVRDPVCGMRVDRWRAKATAKYGDEEYVFCTLECHDKFMEAPYQYANKTEN